jgi:mersacidin/lichenicidin family type 2 lantibiotic
MDVIRAWRDPEYRRGLSPTELEEIPPNPAGTVQLADVSLYEVSGYGGMAPNFPTQGCTGGCPTRTCLGCTYRCPTAGCTVGCPPYTASITCLITRTAPC